jgi:hypothetical protein
MPYNVDILFDLDEGQVQVERLKIDMVTCSSGCHQLVCRRRSFRAVNLLFADRLASFLVQPAYVVVRNDMERALKPIRDTCVLYVKRSH